MKIVIDANWDNEANVWCAVAREELGLVTEASSLDALRDRISAMLPDLLEHGGATEVAFDLVVHSAGGLSGPIAAE